MTGVILTHEQQDALERVCEFAGESRGRLRVGRVVIDQETDRMVDNQGPILVTFEDLPLAFRITPMGTVETNTCIGRGLRTDDRDPGDSGR